MGTPVKLKVGEKEILSTDVSYNDLLVLYKQYIDIYGKVPTSKTCDFKHNMPQYRIIKNVLKNNSIDEKIFKEQFFVKDKKVANQIKHYKNQFPIVINGLTYTLFGDVIVSHKDNNRNSYYLNLIDDFGYKYCCTYKNISSAKNNNINLNRFFKGNKYTYENINLYCKLNNIDLSIDGTNLPVSGYAKINLPFINSCCNTIMINWNKIQKIKIDDCFKDKKISIKNKTQMTKEKAISIILDKYKELNRPLLQSDFEGIETTNESIGIRVVWRIWGTFTNMVKELGLPEHDCYYKPNSENYKSHEEIMNSIKNVCDVFVENNRKVIMVKDLEDLTGLNIKRLQSHCKKDNTTLNDILKLYGCELQKAVNGLNHIFEDGEKVVSRYEYDFSDFLKKSGFVYDVNYFRNIPYKYLDNHYDGNMNCDYLIIFGNKKVYIELAGILGNKEHQEAYRNNFVINSKSKELYRQKLYQKREIFERNGLEYYILLPDEMNENTYQNILNKYLKEVA